MVEYPCKNQTWGPTPSPPPPTLRIPLPSSPHLLPLSHPLLPPLPTPLSPSTPPTPEIRPGDLSPLLLTSGGHRWRLSSHLVQISNGGHPSQPPSPLPPTHSFLPYPLSPSPSTPPTQDMRPGDLFPPLLPTSGVHRWRLSPN